MDSELKTHLFKVEMTCEGCQNAVTNVLNKHKDQGISEFEVNLAENIVTIKSQLEKEAIMEILKKTGKTTTVIEENP